MCCNTFKIKPVNGSASNRIFCQCGICEDCRKQERNTWSYRLQAEILARSKQNWNVGFITLTYDENHLPRYSFREEVRDDWSGTDVFDGMPCFSRSDVRTFILRLRKYLWKHYDIKGISYMVCSELGKSETARPHYHAILSWPPVVDYETMHKLIESLWCDKGFIFPKDYRGGVDSHGFRHKPFQVDNLNDSARYCAKYVCKDLDFLKMCRANGVNLKDKYFRSECAPFHIQSRGLGFQFIANLSPSDKLKVLTDGFAFAGEEFLRTCPVYFRNKIVFDTYYVYDIYTKNRLVRRKANEFFEQNKNVIYNDRLETYTRFFEQIKSDDYNINRLSEFLQTTYSHAEQFVDLQDVITNVVRNVSAARSLPSRWMAEYYLSYYKVPLQYRLVDPVESWYNHYLVQPKKSDVMLSAKDGRLDEVVTCSLLAMSFLHNPVRADQALIDYVSDYHKSME